MGIKGLMKLIADEAPGSVKEGAMKSYFGRKVAIDASMSIYQFLVAVRSGPDSQMLTNEAGEVTSHLQGMFYRTIRMMENGLKPCYVFDGKAPELKSGELEMRKEAKRKAAENLKAAEEEGNVENIAKYKKRTVRATKQQSEDCKVLLTLMGVPVVQASGEAEAQCAAMCQAGLVYAAATEDMDALTFGTSILVRHLTFSEARKMPIVEINLKAVLAEMNLSMEQFIDFCILCGCDYTKNIRGIGPKKAIKLIRKHGNLETIIQNLNRETYKFEDSEFLYKEARELFRNPSLTDVKTLKLTWKDPDEEGLVKFLSEERGFSEERVRSGIKRLRKAKKKGSQKRLESFFGPVTVTKRKKPVKKGKGGPKKKKGKFGKR